MIVLRAVREAAGPAGVAGRGVPDLLLVRARVRRHHRDGLVQPAQERLPARRHLGHHL